MKKTIILALMLCIIASVHSKAQYVYKIKADSVKITNDSCTAELILENSTKAVKGVLYNYGNGRTEFRKAMLKLNDSLYLFGNDTLNVAAAIRVNGSNGLSSISLSSLLGANKANTIQNYNYQQEWRWDSLSSGSGLSIKANTTEAINPQRLFHVELAGEHRTPGQTTYAAYITNHHSSSSSVPSANIGVYGAASGNHLYNGGGRFEASGNYPGGLYHAVLGYAVNTNPSDRSNTHAGYFTNNGGNNVIRLEQESASEIAGIGFAGVNGTWGFGKRNTTGALEFNNSFQYLGHKVLQLFPENRLRVGGESDDGIHTFQVYGTTWLGNNVGVMQSNPSSYLHIGSGTAAIAPLKFAAGTSLATPQNGAVEYDGTNYYVTSGGTRFTLSKTLTATATLDFANTTAQNFSDLTVTVTGAVDGDAVSLGIPSSSISGAGSYTAWVSAANTVTVRFNNFGASAINPASGSFKIVITKN